MHADLSWPRFTAESAPPSPPPQASETGWSRFGSLPPRDHAPAAPPAAEYVPPVAEATPVPVWRTPAPAPASTALVALRQPPEVALGDVLHAARKALPAVAVAALVTAGALRWLRGR